MCSIKEVKAAGYSASTSDGSSFTEDYCPTVEKFLNNFKKTNYSLSIDGRASNQLFPLSDVTETDITPIIKFNENNLNVYYTATNYINGLTYENVSGLTATIYSPTGLMGTASATLNILTEGRGNVSGITAKNTGLYPVTYTVYVNGAGIGGGTGITSSSFTITQYYQVVRVIINLGNSSLSGKLELYDGNNDPRETISSAIIGVCLIPGSGRYESLDDYPLINSSYVGGSNAWKIIPHSTSTKFSYEIKHNGSTLYSDSNVLSLDLNFYNYYNEVTTINDEINVWLS